LPSAFSITIAYRMTLILLLETGLFKYAVQSARCNIIAPD
jgi:hypothetical protein